MSKYQPKHKRPRGNEHTTTVWVFGMFLSVIALTIIMHYNSATGIVTLNTLATVARIVLSFAFMWLVFAVLLAVFTVWNLEREARNSSRKWAEYQSRRS